MLLPFDSVRLKKKRSLNYLRTSLLIHCIHMLYNLLPILSISISSKQKQIMLKL